MDFNTRILKKLGGKVVELFTFFRLSDVCSITGQVGLEKTIHKLQKLVVKMCIKIEGI